MSARGLRPLLPGLFSSQHRFRCRDRKDLSPSVQVPLVSLNAGELLADRCWAPSPFFV